MPWVCSFDTCSNVFGFFSLGHKLSNFTSGLNETQRNPPTFRHFHGNSFQQEIIKTLLLILESLIRVSKLIYSMYVWYGIELKTEASAVSL